MIAQHLPGIADHSTREEWILVGRSGGAVAEDLNAVPQNVENEDVQRDPIREWWKLFPANGNQRVTSHSMRRWRRNPACRHLRLLILTWFCLVLRGSCLLAAEDSPEFAVLKSQYEKKFLEYATERDQQKAEGLEKYRPRLATALQKAQASGNFEATKRLLEETERTAEFLVDLAGLEKHDVPEVANLRIALRQVYESADRRFKEQHSALIIQYLRPLDRLKSQLVKQGNLEAAVAVDAEMSRVNEELAVMDGIPRSQGGLQLPASFERDLIVHFGFDKDEGVQTTASNDETFIGSVQGPQWIEKGKLGGAYSFDGIDDQINLTKQLPDSKGLTVGVWIHYQGQGGDGGIFSDWGAAGGNDLFFSLNGPGGAYVRADKEGEKLSGNISFEKSLQGDWYHLVWTMDSSESVIYVNGEKVGELRVGGSNIGHHGATIGYAHDGTRQTRFRGSLDELMIWSRALNAKDVAELYTLQK